MFMSVTSKHKLECFTSTLNKLQISYITNFSSIEKVTSNIINILNLINEVLVQFYENYGYVQCVNERFLC